MIDTVKDIILTTTHSLDGYRIVKYLDVISAEAIYKLSAGKSLSAMLSDAVDSMRIFSNNELRGTTKIIQEAKDYVKSELCRKAADLGANAVVGIDIESSVADDGLAKASINGTAVIIQAAAGVSPELKIPVAQYNHGSEIRPFELSISNNGHSVLDLYCPFHDGVSGILVDIALSTIFDDNYQLDDMAFLNFSAGKNGHLFGNCDFCSVPEEILSIVKNCDITIKKYVENGHVVELTDDRLILAPSGEAQPGSRGAFSLNDLLSDLNAFRTAREILDHLKNHSDEYAQFISPELMEIIEKKVNIERMYGNRKDACIDEIKKYYSNN